MFSAPHDVCFIDRDSFCFSRFSVSMFIILCCYDGAAEAPMLARSTVQTDSCRSDIFMF